MEMNQSDQINELGMALAKAQGQIEGAKKDSANPFFKSKYADLSSVWDAIRKALSDNGLSVIQSPEDAENGITVESMILHSSGQWIKSRYTMPVSKLDAQAVGSAITYARRYALAAMIGVAPEDDDGNKAVSAKPAINEPKNLPNYTDDKMDENIDAWESAIKSGKHTPENIINMVSTKHKLSDDQKKTIRLLGKEDVNENS
jgi:hypothetical protein